MAAEGRATIRSISSATGFSLATVSRALKASPDVRADTARIVTEAAERLGYRRSAAGANLRSGKSGILSLVMPIVRPGDMLGDVGALQLVAGACARLASSSCSLNLVPYVIGDQAPDPVAEVIRHGMSDGVILTLTAAQDERVKLLHGRDIPFVTFGRTELALRHAHYDVDNIDFAFRAAQWLLGQGCRRPVMVVQPGPGLFSWHRRIGFERALALAGLPFTDGMIIAQNDFATVHRLARTAVPPDGVICDGEVSTLAIMSALTHEGLKVGHDVHVTTMETSAMPALFSPPISGFFQDAHRAGWMLADLLLKRMAGVAPEDLAVVETVTFRDRSNRISHDAP